MSRVFSGLLSSVKDYPLIEDYLKSVINGDYSFVSDDSFLVSDELFDEVALFEREKFIRYYKPNVSIDTESAMNHFNDYIKHVYTTVFTIGLPGSGKTSFVRKYFPEDMVFCYDNEVAAYYNSHSLEDILYMRQIIENDLKFKMSRSSLVVDSTFVRMADRQLLKKNYSDDFSYRIDDPWSYHNAFALLFDTPVSDCYNRIKKRFKEKEGQVYNLYDILRFLISFDNPLSSHLIPEEGIDLVFVINQSGELKSAYPLSRFQEIINTH